MSMTVCLGLLSKQMMVVFMILVPLFLLVSSADRPLLKQPWPYLFIALPILGFVPVLWWNVQHDWITMEHTASQIAGYTKGSFHVLKFLGSQFLIVSPVTFLLFSAVAGTLLFTLHKQDRSVRYLLVFSVVPLVFVLLMSFRQRINPNWPAVFYPAGIVLLAGWACKAIHGPGSLNRFRRFSQSG